MIRNGGWRSSAATWAGAAWFVLQQFGVPATTSNVRDSRIVRVEEAGTTAADMECLPDGRILTVPVDPDGSSEDSQVPREEFFRFSRN